MHKQVIHHTFTFDRRCAAPVDQVFAAFADPAIRARWSAPSDTARCGSKENPQYTGRTTYATIQPNALISSSEVVEAGGQVLMSSLITTMLDPDGDATRVHMVVQVISFCGADMIRGTDLGNNASLDNLVAMFEPSRRASA
jgi:uncharacterized protein YndB with AHSA1/START domain